MTQFKAMAVLLVALCWSANASAEWFMRGFGGGNILDDSGLQITGVPGQNFDAKFKDSFVAGGALGYLARKTWRFEAEISYRENDLDKLDASGTAVTAFGKLSSVAVMANFFWEFQTRLNFKPYIGFGVGGAYVSADDFIVSGVPVADDSKLVLAYQAGVGAAIIITRDVDLMLDYRYLIAEDPNFKAIEAEYHNHSFMAGLRLHF